MTSNRLQDVLLGKTPDCTPIWIMRQAGRHLPEYRKLREKVGSFKRLYSSYIPEVTLMPLKRYDLDAAIIFSDILIALDAMGMNLEFIEGRGPVIENPVRDAKVLAQLRNSPAEDAYTYLAEGIKETRAELAPQIPLIGFVGSPWTLAVYGTEGAASKGFDVTRRILYNQPSLLSSFLGALTREVIQLALLQVRAGVDIIQIFDSWAGLLPSHLYKTFSLAYTQLVVKEIHRCSPHTPIILFARECALPLSELCFSGVTALSLDWKRDIKQCFVETQSSVILQGNLDPAALYAEDQVLKNEVQRILASKPVNAGHIFNLGHGISPDVSPDKVSLLVDLVHTLGEF